MDCAPNECTSWPVSDDLDLYVVPEEISGSLRTDLMTAWKSTQEIRKNETNPNFAPLKKEHQRGNLVEPFVGSDDQAKTAMYNLFSVSQQVLNGATLQELEFPEFEWEEVCEKEKVFYFH